MLPEEEVKPGAPEWVVTFGDMMSLLLTFFVLLLSFSTMEVQKFKVVAGYMRQAFGLQAKFSYTGVPMGTTILSTDARTEQVPGDEFRLIEKLRKAVEGSGFGKKGSVQVTPEGVAVRLEGEVLFPTGKATLRPEAYAMLDKIAEVAKKENGIIEVAGHSDNVPIHNSRFPSNWELSAARAGSAARYLIERGVPPSRIRAVGYADTRPVAPNDTEEHRSQNRRVEFVFIRQVQGTGSNAGAATEEDPEVTQSVREMLGLEPEPGTPDPGAGSGTSPGADLDPRDAKR